eukprot:2677623-Amphidinium_carterae.1
MWPSALHFFIGFPLFAPKAANGTGKEDIASGVDSDFALCMKRKEEKECKERPLNCNTYNITSIHTLHCLLAVFYFVRVVHIGRQPSMLHCVAETTNAPNGNQPKMKQHNQIKER